MNEKQPECAACDSTGWVCENHPDREWESCPCGGAGDPCKVCNTGSPPRMPPDFTVIWNIENGTHH